MTVKTVVYTCITGNYDILRDIRREPGFDYVCFTNNRLLQSDVWNMVYIDEDLPDPILQRKMKILGYRYFPDYELLIYMDSNVSIRNGFRELLERECDLDAYDMVRFRHRRRDCVYQELDACVTGRRETLEKCLILESFLRSENYPEHNGLTENTVFIQKNIPEVNRLMDDWWEMLFRFSGRDQLTFNYCLWKRPVRMQFLNINVFDNYYLVRQPHEELTLLPYRLVFDTIHDYVYDLHAIVEGSVLLTGGVVHIEAPCPKDSPVARLFFPEAVGSSIRNVLLSSSAPSGKPLYKYMRFKKIGPDHYITKLSFIEFYGGFRAGGLFSVSVEIKHHDALSLVEQLVKQKHRSRHTITRLESSFSYRLGRALTFIPRRLRDSLSSYETQPVQEELLDYLQHQQIISENLFSSLENSEAPLGQYCAKTAVIYFDLHHPPLFKPYFEASGAVHLNHFRNRTAAILAGTRLGRYLPPAPLWSNPPKGQFGKIIVFDSLASQRQLNWLCARHPEARIILWFWNPAKRRLLKADLNPRIELWTYSAAESRKYALRLNTQFFFDSLVPRDPSPERHAAPLHPSVLFIGREKARGEALNTIRQELEAAGATVELQLLPSPGRKKYNWLYEKTSPYADVLARSRNCDIILDFALDPSGGLSLRPLEAMFLGKKLITNNRTVIDMDFYHPNNIYVYGLDPRSFSEFFSCDYVPVPAEIREKYLFSNWLKRFDTSDGNAQP